MYVQDIYKPISYVFRNAQKKNQITRKRNVKTTYAVKYYPHKPLKAAFFGKI